MQKVYLTGYTPYPMIANDKRLPHLSKKISSQIQKTALGAEKLLQIGQNDDIAVVLEELHNKGYQLCALEQAPHSIALPEFRPTDKVMLIVGREVEGLEAEILQAVDHIVEIPMHGRKESFNVVQAAAIALYHIVHSA